MICWVLAEPLPLPVTFPLPFPLPLPLPLMDGVCTVSVRTNGIGDGEGVDDADFWRFGGVGGGIANGSTVEVIVDDDDVDAFNGCVLFNLDVQKFS